MGETILGLGGMRSGKSRLAEGLAAERPVAYGATATRDPADAEMAARQRARRPADWANHKVPRDLAATLPPLPESSGSVLVDGATLWLANLILGLGGGPPRSAGADW